MKTPFSRLVAAIAARLGYVPAERLCMAQDELACVREELLERASRAEEREARTKETLQAVEAQNRRLQIMADAVLTARANAQKYGLPLSQAFELEFSTERDAVRDQQLYRLSIRPRAAYVGFAVDRFAIQSCRETPEVFARKALQELLPRFETELGRAIHAGALAAA